MQRLFSGSSLDSGVISCSIAEHKLGIPKGRKLIFQKKRAFAKARQEVIKKEFKELLETGIIKPFNFPECLSNPVVVAKIGRAWRVCINFIDLNKAIPKKPYPLPCIDQLVDSIAGHELLSFIEGDKVYH